MTKVIELVDADVEEITEMCRDDRCEIDGIHAAHPISGRGRTPKSCPMCMTAIPRGQGAKCLACGWDRKRGGS